MCEGLCAGLVRGSCAEVLRGPCAVVLCGRLGLRFRPFLPFWSRALLQTIPNPSVSDETRGLGRGNPLLSSPLATYHCSHVRVVLFPCSGGAYHFSLGHLSLFPLFPLPWARVILFPCSGGTYHFWGRMSLMGLPGLPQLELRPVPGPAGKLKKITGPWKPCAGP